MQENLVQECTLCLRICWGESFGQYVIVRSESFRNSVRKKNNLLSEIERTLPWKETLAQRNFLIVFWKIYKAIFNLECRKTVRIYFSDFVRKGGEGIFSLQTKWKSTNWSQFWMIIMTMIMIIILLLSLGWWIRWRRWYEIYILWVTCNHSALRGCCSAKDLPIDLTRYSRDHHYHQHHRHHHTLPHQAGMPRNA